MIVARSGYAWLVGWVLWSVGAGALAGVGLIEFNWGGPPYDGGFAGELALFGGFLALGQAPFMAVFAWSACRRVRGSVAVYVGALTSVAWTVVGLVGWTLGSFVEVSLETPLYSVKSLLAGVLPWAVVGALQAVVVAAVIAGAGNPRAALFAGAVWAVASILGGFSYEYWTFLDVAAKQNRIKDVIGSYLESAGVAENVAFEVVPAALFLPLLYGAVTGLALAFVGGKGKDDAAGGAGVVS